MSSYKVERTSQSILPPPFLVNFFLPFSVQNTLITQQFALTNTKQLLLKSWKLKCNLLDIHTMQYIFCFLYIYVISEEKTFNRTPQWNKKVLYGIPKNHLENTNDRDCPWHTLSKTGSPDSSGTSCIIFIQTTPFSLIMNKILAFKSKYFK